MRERASAANGSELARPAQIRIVVRSERIPSTDPIFLGVVVGFHIPLGLACVVFGAVAMLSTKGRSLIVAPCCAIRWRADR
jgi:hypothetical protein